MSQSITDKPKKPRGRPYQGGRDPMSGVRMPSEEKRAIEAWGAKQSPPLTFSGALRHLAKLGLESAPAKSARKKK